MALASAVLVRSHALARHHAEVTAADLSKSLEQTLSGVLGRIDLSLLAIGDEILHQKQTAGLVDLSRLKDLLSRQDSRVPDVLGFRFYGEDGVLKAGAHAIKDPLSSIADRDYFEKLRNGSSPGLFLSPPQIGHTSGRWVITLARRIGNPDGSFGGVVTASLAISHLAEVVSGNDLGPHGVVSVFNTTPVYVVRYPLVDGVVGGGQLSGQVRDFVGSGRDRLDYEYLSPVDDTARIAVARRMAAYPLVVLVGLAKDDVFAEWRRDVVELGAVAAAFALVTLAMTVLLLRGAGQRRAAVTALVESEDRYRGLIESQTDFVVRLSLDGNFNFVNASFAQAFGRPPAALLGRSWREVIHPGDITATTQAIKAALTPPAFRATVESRILIPGGVRWVAWEGGAVFDAGKTILELQAVGRDITEWVVQRDRLKRLVAELDASNQELEQFAYVASHDLREPLRTISSYMALLDRRYGDGFDKDAHDFIGYAREGAVRMDRMVLDLLEFSRVGRLKQPFQPVALSDAIEAARMILETSIAEAGAEIRVSPSLPIVMGSKAELTRLFQNLIGNAVKYRSPHRPPVITISAAGPRDGEWIIAIADNGIGIARDYFERIFSIFQRLHTRDKYDGTGIGLALCRKIAQRHGGRLWVESTPDVGSTFFLALAALVAGGSSSGVEIGQEGGHGPAQVP